jgi:hypothetical protein
MSPRQVTVGVVGHGSPTDNLVCDALNEHFEFGPADSEGYFGKSLAFDVHVMFPAGSRFTAGIEAVWQWAVRAEIPFLAVSDGTHFPSEEAVRGSLLQVDDWREVDVPEAEILDVLHKSVNPMVLVLTDSGEYNADLRDTAAAALARGIPVYDLSRALLEQGWADLGLDPVEDTALDEPAPSLQITTEDARSIAATLAQAFALFQELRQVAGTIGDLQPAIAAAERALRLPTPPAVPEASEEEQPPLPEQSATAAPADDEPQGDVSGARRTRLEVYDEQTDTWRPAGRGRPKQGVKTRRVPR